MSVSDHLSPSISVIIPVYQCFSYLPACISSVLSQTFSDFELILVDDGSDDGSEKLCDFYAAADSRIQVIHQRNKGVSAARNTGIAASHGYYLLFIDSDDTVSPDFFELLYQEAKKTSSMLTICGYSFFINKTKQEQIVLPEISNIINISHLCASYPKLFLNRIFLSVWGKLFCGDIIRTHGLHFSEQFSIGEDFLFLHNYLYLMKPLSIAVVNKALYRYIQYPNLGRRLSDSHHLSRIQTVGQLFVAAKTIYKKLHILDVGLPCIALYYMRTLCIVFGDSNLQNAEAKVEFRKCCYLQETKSALSALPFCPEALLYQIVFRTHSFLFLHFTILIRKQFLHFRNMYVPI